MDSWTIFDKQIELHNLEYKALQKEAELAWPDFSDDDAEQFLQKLEVDEKTILSLPNSLKINGHIFYRNYLLRFLQNARRALISKNYLEAKIHLLKLQRNYARAKHDEWVMSLEAREEIGRHAAARGGKNSGLRKWALMAATRVLSTPRPKTNAEVWRKIPESSEAWEFPIGEFEYEVYKDGNQLVSIRCRDNHESKIQKSTFFRTYLKKARDNCK